MRVLGITRTGKNHSHPLSFVISLYHQIPPLFITITSDGRPRRGDELAEGRRQREGITHRHTQVYHHHIAYF